MPLDVARGFVYAERFRVYMRRYARTGRDLRSGAALLGLRRVPFVPSVPASPLPVQYRFPGFLRARDDCVDATGLPSRI